MPFISLARRAEKFKQHGADFAAEMGFAGTEVKYEALADIFLTGDPSLNTRECTRTNGEKVRYNQFTEEFGIWRNEGIVTYFKPDPEVHGEPNNLEYFYRTCRE